MRISWKKLDLLILTGIIAIFIVYLTTLPPTSIGGFPAAELNRVATPIRLNILYAVRDPLINRTTYILSTPAPVISSFTSLSDRVYVGILVSGPDILGLIYLAIGATIYLVIRKKYFKKEQKLLVLVFIIIIISFIQIAIYNVYFSIQQSIAIQNSHSMDLKNPLTNITLGGNKYSVIVFKEIIKPNTVFIIRSNTTFIPAIISLKQGNKSEFSILSVPRTSYGGFVSEEIGESYITLLIDSRNLGSKATIQTIHFIRIAKPSYLYLLVPGITQCIVLATAIAVNYFIRRPRSYLQEPLQEKQLLSEAIDQSS